MNYSGAFGICQEGIEKNLRRPVDSLLTMLYNGFITDEGVLYADFNERALCAACNG